MTPPGQADGLDRLESSIRRMMEAAWREPGYCVPNQDVYPHQWLWDSCFHALIWTSLGSDRGITELTTALARQAADGFVPHMIYWSDPDVAAAFWGRAGSSSITQPPMYGHAIAELMRAEHPVPDELIEQAALGLRHLGSRTRTTNGLIPVYHPWETGCDDSARWDGWLLDRAPTGPAPIGSPARTEERSEMWRARKGELVDALVLSDAGHAVGNPDFAVGSVGFNALVAFNARELARTDGAEAAELNDLADELTEAVAARWRGSGWADDDVTLGGGARTLDSMLPLLIDPKPQGFEQLASPQGFAAPYGPRGAHADEPSYDPDRYWRGPAWPQLSYLMMIAAERAGETNLAAAAAAGLVAGAERSQLAEYWNPETGAGLGARPQTWAGLGLCAAGRLR